jgi:hypothetical protein
MEEEDIETWYEEQKDRLTEKYRLRVDKVKKEDKEKLKTEYLKNLNSLHAKYENMSKKTSDSNLKRFFFSYGFGLLKEKLLRPFVKLKEKLDDKNKKPE